jgi:hypothetical protein
MFDRFLILAARGERSAQVPVRSGRIGLEP